MVGKYFFVDTENISNYNLIINKLTSNDIVVMMESSNSNYVSIEDFKGLIESKAKIEFEHVEIGRKNALDFQLAMNLAITISENKDKNYQYYIFSADKAFEIVTKYLENKTGKSVKLVIPSQKEILDFSSEDLLDNLDLENLLDAEVNFMFDENVEI